MSAEPGDQLLVLIDTLWMGPPPVLLNRAPTFVNPALPSPLEWMKLHFKFVTYVDRRNDRPVECM